MRILILTGLVFLCWQGRAQSIVGTWQLVDEGTCFMEQKDKLAKTETEKELEKEMSSSGASSVARLIRFDKKGSGEEGIFSVGKKKAAGMSPFKYKVNDNQLVLVDVKSGIMTQQFVIDTLTQSRLSIHNSKKDCETRVFTRVK
jgi:hypothetical protein